jgi:DNA replication protein DnaC
MLVEQTLEKLQAMKLRAMAAAVEEQLNDPGMQDIPFEDRLGFVVDREFMERENRRLTRRLRDARFRFAARIDDLEYKRRRKGLDRALVQELATCEWIRRHHNVIITGATGLGKTFVACALGNRACQMGFRVISWRMPTLFQELSVGKIDGSYRRIMKRISTMDVLIVDDWGIHTLTDPERRDFLEIVEARYDLGSTIVCTQLPVENWHDAIGDPTIADSILDRLIHNAYRITLTGESLRKPEGKKGAPGKGAAAGRGTHR